VRKDKQEECTSWSML